MHARSDAHVKQEATRGRTATENRPLASDQSTAGRVDASKRFSVTRAAMSDTPFQHRVRAAIARIDERAAHDWPATSSATRR